MSYPLYRGDSLAEFDQNAASSSTEESEHGLQNLTQRANSTESKDLSTVDSTTLTANQIITIIHQRSTLIVDLKHVMSEFLLSRGIAVHEDSVTDEILFSNIASSRDLRSYISMWLRARGYIDDQRFSDMPGDPAAFDKETVESTEPVNLGQHQLPTHSSQEQVRLPNDSAIVLQDTFGVPESPLGLQDTAEIETAAKKQHDVDLGLRQHPPKNPQQYGQQTDTALPNVLHLTAPYNLQSLRDLYTQLAPPATSVLPFGYDLFTGHGASDHETSHELPIDLPIGPDYILGPGDAVTISVWGSVSQNYKRIVSPDGNLVLPEAGPLQVAGLTLANTEQLVQRSLANQFRDAHVLVSLARLRTVRIYVVGDVLRPGAYDIASLSTPLNALYAAGGPTKTGSLRRIRHMRGKSLVNEIDLYNFLCNGVRNDAERLQSGDTILVPPIGASATVTGMVKRPAIYELKIPETLSEVLDEAGGLKPDASITHIRIERIEADGRRRTTEIELPQNATVGSARERINRFALRDGDKIIVAPVLPYSESVIYTVGHFLRPGRVPFREGMSVGDVIHSFQDLLPEPSLDGEIIRLMPPDHHAEAILFNLRSVIDAPEGAMKLFPFDTIVVRGRYDADAPQVMIRGDVIRPGSYALAEGMTAGQLVRIAGGFKRSAFLQTADLESYVVDNEHVVPQHSTIPIGSVVLSDDRSVDVKLHSGDILTIHRIPGWDDIGASVTLLGEVVYPGTYGIEGDETISSIIHRAGGFRTTAYPQGAVMIRRQVKQFELKSRNELIRQVETVSAGARLGSAGTDTGSLQLLVQQQNQILQRLKTEPVIGRLVININADISSWEDTGADIRISPGDVITIPKRPAFVLVTGQAYNTSAISYVPGKDAGWYLQHAGGPTDMANRKEVYVIRANGEVVGRRSGEWYQRVLSTRLNPGDVVVVPQKIVGGSTVWKNTLAAAQVVSSIAFTAALALR